MKWYSNMYLTKIYMYVRYRLVFSEGHVKAILQLDNSFLDNQSLTGSSYQYVAPYESLKLKIASRRSVSPDGT